MCAYECVRAAQLKLVIKQSGVNGKLGHLSLLSRRLYLAQRNVVLALTENRTSTAAVRLPAFKTRTWSCNCGNTVQSRHIHPNTYILYICCINTYSHKQEQISRHAYITLLHWLCVLYACFTAGTECNMRGECIWAEEQKPEVDGVYCWWPSGEL